MWPLPLMQNQGPLVHFCGSFTSYPTCPSAVFPNFTSGKWDEDESCGYCAYNGFCIGHVISLVKELVSADRQWHINTNIFPYICKHLPSVHYRVQKCYALIYVLAVAKLVSIQTGKGTPLKTSIISKRNSNLPWLPHPLSYKCPTH